MKTEYMVLSALIGLVIGFALGRIRPKNMNIYQFLRKIYTNLDNFILIFSFGVVVAAIYFSTVGKLEEFSTIVVNTFGSVVFSWLLTKKSSKVEFKEQEEALALRSYRHINYIESAANTAYKKIQKYVEEEELGSREKLMLNSAMDQIKYIQGGINTCKMDWHDMLSDEEKEHYKYENMRDKNYDNDDYGTVEVVFPTNGYNQEDV